MSRRNSFKANKASADAELKDASSGISFVQVLGTGTDTGDTTPSVLLFFDQKRYIFNVGEGFQRFCVEHKVKLAKMSGILATRVSTEAIGGLPGMLLTLSDKCHGIPAGPSTIELYGPKGLNMMVRALRSFIDADAIGLAPHEFSPAEGSGAESGHSGVPPVVQNKLVTITPVILHPAVGSAQQSTAHHGGVSPETDPEGPAAKKQRVESLPGVRNWGDQPAMAGPAVEAVAACYICELPTYTGKFLPERALELKVLRGRLWADLKKGTAVKATDGRMVQPEEVTEAAVIGPVTIVADCPSASYLPSLVSAPEFQRWTSGGAESTSGSSSSGSVSCIVHLAPSAVVESAEYQAWMASFGGSVNHIIVNPKAVGMAPVMKTSAFLQAQLNLLHPGFFPLHQSWKATGSAVSPPSEGVSAAAQEPSEGKSSGMLVFPGHNLTKFHLRPAAKLGVDSGEVSAEVVAAQVQAELKASHPEVLAAAAAGLEHASGNALSSVPEAIRRMGREELEIVFLGTGAAIPSKYRNVTGIYLNFFGRGGMLLDCGEGSYGQLRRRYGSEGADAVIAGLKCIWVSHIHADHHAGIARILNARQRLLGEDCPPLPIIGPHPLRSALAAYSQLEPMSYHYVNTYTTVPPPIGSPEGASAGVLHEVRAALGLTKLQSVRVAHCAHAFAAVLEGGSGWKVVFSGDTRPCEDLVAASAGATVLIHEATFDDTMEKEAVAKRHSMTHEAVDVGRRAGAYRTILTHFSQRYPKIPVIDKSFQDSTCIAFDLMSVNLADLPILPALVPALELLFKEFDEIQEEAA